MRSWNQAIRQGSNSSSGCGVARQALYGQAFSRAIWKSLDAVKNNRMHKVPYYGLFFDDPIAIEHQMEMLTNLILK
jgi:iron complex transport system substrate-binding protein